MIASSAVPNSPSLTVTPLYNSPGGLLEIETLAREGVGYEVQWHVYTFPTCVSSYLASEGVTGMVDCHTLLLAVSLL